VIYVDTSALLKLVWDEDESPSLRRYLDDSDRGLVSSVLIAVETRRSVQRDAPHRLPRADLLLTRVIQISVTAPIVESAGRLPDRSLRSLDAIHLATALLLKPDLEALLSYDKRLSAVAAAHAIPVVAPV